MPDYSLSGLNPRSFEHIVQALAKGVIAAGVEPFGDGPDGGREAIFRGRMEYPSKADPWDGYLLIQSKHCLHPTGDPKKDGDWLIDQLNADFAKFSDPKRSLEIPDYYLATTNIRMSPVAKAGSKDRVDACLAAAKARLGFRSGHVWGYDDLCRFLDNNADVRRAYSHLITPGDVLSGLQESVDLFKGLGSGKSPMWHLAERFKKERENDEVFSGIVEKLQHYSSTVETNGKVEGLEEKLGKAGYETFLQFALSTKELFAKKLATLQFSRSAQEIMCLLLAEVYTRFHHHVWPALCDGRSKAEVQALVQTQVIVPLSGLLEENVLGLGADDLTGMLYFLTGNCHIRWKEL